MKIRDAIHGMVDLSEFEMKIIDTRAFQRLRNIRQLATSYLVYPGAEHTRFGHSIGTMHVATRVIENIRRENPSCVYQDEHEQAMHWEWMTQMIRLIALTHDLGHPPFSHAGEGLLPNARKHEAYTAEIILNSDIGRIINEIGEKFNKEHSTDKYIISADEVVNIYLGYDLFTSDKLILNYLMDSELDCDKMDYLLRDSHYCGVSYGTYDLERLIPAIQIDHPPDDEDVSTIVIHEDGLHAFEEFVLARYFMFLQVYFHKTRRILDISMSNFIKTILPDGTNPVSTEDYLQWDDNRILQAMYNPQNIESEIVQQVIGRKFPRLVYQTNAHAGANDSEIYNRTKRRIINNNLCTKTELVEDDASKMPHNIPMLTVSDEKAVYVKRFDGSTTNIINCSYILAQIRMKIDIHRIYVPYDKKDATRTFVQDLIANRP